MQLRNGSLPTSIQIKSYKITSEITVNNAIYIRHWKDSKLILAKQTVNLRVRIVAK